MVVGGGTYDPPDLTEVTSIWDHGVEAPNTYADPTFYATSQGQPAFANCFVEGLTISGATCTLEMGRGKNKNQVVGTTISFTASFAYGVTAPATLNFSGEGHMLVRPAGSAPGTYVQVSERMDTPQHDAAWTYSRTFEGDLSGAVEVECH